jgi:putative ABC transport system ATP-binding protein
MREIIQLKNIKKIYNMQDNNLIALCNIAIKVEKGEFLCIMGQSGSGKSTLLNIIGLLDNYNEGEYILNGLPITNFNDFDYASIRNNMIGFVFQSSNLISHKSAIENVALPLFYRGISRKERFIKAEKYLEIFNLKDWAKHKPDELSGGQKQRVAIARALVTEPELILADEPTGALDSATSVEIMNILKDINNDGKTIIMVTHEKELSQYASRIVTLKDGKIKSDMYQNHLVYNEVAFN